METTQKKSTKIVGIKNAGLFVLAGELMVWVSPDLCQVEFEGRYRFAVHYYSGY